MATDYISEEFKRRQRERAKERPAADELVDVLRLFTTEERRELVAMLQDFRRKYEEWRGA